MKSENCPVTRILGVFAHPDDETFCAGGTIAKYAASGAEVILLCATTGEAGQIRDAAVATRRTLGEVRREEFYRACTHLGVSHGICLDYGDGKLQRIDTAILVDEISRVIHKFKPHIMITFGNDGAYGHPDHIAIGAAADNAFYNIRNKNNYPQQLYHSYFPRNSRLLLNHLVRWLKNMDSRFQGTMEFIRSLLYFADESVTLGFSSDDVKIEWYPPGFSIIEQNEVPKSLYLILSGCVDVFQEKSDGRLMKVNEIKEGTFFGEEGLASGEPRNAYCIARDSVSCLVFSIVKQAAYSGRGSEADNRSSEANENLFNNLAATTCIDVSDFIQQKINAITEYRTQFPIDINDFPYEILEEMLSKEYFIRMHPKPELETEFLRIE